MHILITGGAGFIGSNLAIHLEQNLEGAEITCMDNLYRRGSELNVKRLRDHEIDFCWGDVRDPDGFPKGPYDFLIECSAEPSVLAGQDGNPDYLVHTNLSGAYHCLEKARGWNAGFLFLSTSRVYPIRTLESHPWREEATRFAWEDKGVRGVTSHGVDESIPMQGARSLYGATKYAAELLIEEYRQSYGLRAAVNRCGVVSGPWQFGKVDQGIAALWIMAHFFKKTLSYIGYGGKGKQVRDFLHVLDLCELVADQIRFFDDWDGWLGNVSGGLGHSASLMELTQMCEQITGHSIPIHGAPDNRPNDLRLYIGDNRRLFQKTQWRPKRDVGTTLKDLYEWVQQNDGALRSIH